MLISHINKINTSSQKKSAATPAVTVEEITSDNVQCGSSSPALFSRVWKRGFAPLEKPKRTVVDIFLSKKRKKQSLYQKKSVNLHFNNTHGNNVKENI